MQSSANFATFNAKRLSVTSLQTRTCTTVHVRAQACTKNVQTSQKTKGSCNRARDLDEKFKQY